MNRRTAHLLLITPAAALAMPLLAQAADAPMGEATMLNANQLKWSDAPPALPKGAKFTVLSGDPGKPGPYVLRVKMPANYRIAPHWHTQPENLTVLSGTFYLGLGDKFDAKQAHALKAGGFHLLPGKTNHYAYTKSPTVLQVHAEGPFDITYLNPEDNPDKSAAKN
ncbi:MAG TPA: cupin domain-containing protein [Methylibium sp.]